MDVAITLAGLVVLLLVTGDMIVTTVSGQGQGRLSAEVGESVYSMLGWVGTRINFTRLKRMTGAIVLLSVGAFWLTGIWFGWTLIFFGAELVVIPEPEDIDRFFAALTYIGSVISTVGSSRLDAAGFAGRLLTGIAGLQGIIVLTLTVSYLLNLTQTVVKGRAFSLHIGKAKEFDDLDRSSAMGQFTQLCSQLSIFPLAIYFAPPRQAVSTADALAHFICLVREDSPGGHEREVLEEAVMLLPLLTERAGEKDMDDLERWRVRYGSWMR